MLWAICQREDIDLTWIASPHEDGSGALHYCDPDEENDLLPYVVTKPNGKSMSAVWQYAHMRRHACENESTALNTIIKAATLRAMRADLMVTDDPAVLAYDGPGSDPTNVMTSVDALALVGLLLRDEESVPVIGPSKLTFQVYDLAWTAVRAQLPSGWGWGSALVNHSTSTGDDYPTLLFGSFFDRLVRVLKQRDLLHLARLGKASNRSGRMATEALDTLMFNVVGAFDAAAIAAHIGAGLPISERRSAGWQHKDWRRTLGSDALYEMFHKTKPADDLFAVLRTLRNTVHGAGMNSMVLQRSGDTEHLVQIPASEAKDVQERLERIGSLDSWGIRSFAGETYVDPAQLVELLLPPIFTTLDEILVLSPRDALAVGDLSTLGSPPDQVPFDIGSRARACLLYGLAVPTA